MLVRIPPLQDLPNHLATAVALAHPAEFPEFVSNGFFKTSAISLSGAAQAYSLKLAPGTYDVSVLPPPSPLPRIGFPRCPPTHPNFLLRRVLRVFCRV